MRGSVATGRLGTARRTTMPSCLAGPRARLVLILHAAAAVEAGGDRPVHAGCPAEALEDANDGGGDIDLPGISAMPRADRIGVMHVVPAFAEREQSQRPQVGGAVAAAGRERAGADHMAQRVDAPGDVLQHGDADQSGPQQGGQRSVPAAADRQPAANGSPSETAHKAGNAAEIARMAGSAAMSGA
jgi:hypothetical protein